MKNNHEKHLIEIFHSLGEAFRKKGSDFEEDVDEHIFLVFVRFRIRGCEIMAEGFQVGSVLFL